METRGELAIDFANTFDEERGSPVDLLERRESLISWLAGPGREELRELLPVSLPEQATLLREARRLREAIVSLFTALHEGASLPSPAVLVVDRALRSASIDLRLDPDGGTVESDEEPAGFERAVGAAHQEIPAAEGKGPARHRGPRLRRHFVARNPLGALTPVAVAVTELLSTAPPDRLRPCDAPDCPRWFLDTSKAGRRRWCSMARCGNRAKAARYRERHEHGS